MITTSSTGELIDLQFLFDVTADVCQHTFSYSERLHCHEDSDLYHLRVRHFWQVPPRNCSSGPGFRTSSRLLANFQRSAHIASSVPKKNVAGPRQRFGC